jgi:hypothetical protein
VGEELVEWDAGVFGGDDGDVLVAEVLAGWAVVVGDGELGGFLRGFGWELFFERVGVGAGGFLVFFDRDELGAGGSGSPGLRVDGLHEFVVGEDRFALGGFVGLLFGPDFGCWCVRLGEDDRGVGARGGVAAGDVVVEVVGVVEVEGVEGV